MKKTNKLFPYDDVILTDTKKIKREIMFEYEYYETQEEVRKHIQECEGRHTQQVCYSTFHDALTQICFKCRKIRSNLR